MDQPRRPITTLHLALFILCYVHYVTSQVGPSVGTTVVPRVIAIALSIKSRAVQDSRCYLMNGGAVESFFVAEDTPVGSVIGTVSVNGNPDEETGDITLRLQEKQAPVGLRPGTKNITLLRALDREEKEGPANVYVNVRCDRRGTSDPSFVIPVWVRAWDVNDNAPTWRQSALSLSVSEATAVGSLLIRAEAQDLDQPGPHANIHYTVQPGPHSEYVAFASEFEGNLLLKKALDYETAPKLSITLRASDEGKPPKFSDIVLSISVQDADDQNPRFTHQHYTAEIPPDAKPNMELNLKPERLKASDKDTGINAAVHYSGTGDKQDMFRIDKDTGKIYITDKLLQEQRLPTTVVVKATQVDNPDRYALATISVSSILTSTSASLEALRLRFLLNGYSASIAEDAHPGTVVITLTTTAPNTVPLQFYVSDRLFLEKFAINSIGEVILRRPLDYEAQSQYHYQVMVTDGKTNDTTSLNISVLNVNEWEPRFRHNSYEFLGSKPNDTISSQGLWPIGKIEVFDGDKEDYVSLELKGTHSGLFYLNPSGELFMRSEAFDSLNTSNVNLLVVATDSGNPPKQSSASVSVRVPPSPSTPTSVAALLGALAAALTIMAVCVLALVGYIYKNRNSKPPSVPEKKPSCLSRSAMKNKDEMPNGSLNSVSAGASTILASTSSLDLRGTLTHDNGLPNRPSSRFPKSKIAPLPPSDHFTKKLSWDDSHKDTIEEQNNIHDATNQRLADNMNLTVYF